MRSPTVALTTGPATAANGPRTTTGTEAQHSPAGPLKYGHFTGEDDIHSAPGVGTSIAGVGYSDDCLDYNSSVLKEWVTCPDGGSRVWWNTTDEDTRATGWISDCHLSH
ncbi:hypothetical protein [Streptomyces sp. NPDC096013]|uniref:hypothetical protein n=1 Tax=Streptomyces sp. NPDC096013 TaxID=3366069 RepID=UPI003828C12E